MRLLRWLTLPRLIAAIVTLAVFAIAFRAPVDTDTFWHLRAGEWQVEHRALLRIDEFSFTRVGQPWVNLHWGAQIVLYALYAVLGDAGLALFTALLAAGGMAMIYPLLAGDPVQRAFMLILSALASALFWSVRPQMFSFMFSAALVGLLWRFQKGGIDWLWLVPPLMALWANTHPGFALGFILITLAIVGEVARWALSRLAPEPDQGGAPTFRPVARLAIVAGVSAAAVLINPFGVEALLLPFRTVGIGVLRDFIQEWASPNFHEPQTWPFALLLVGAPLGAALVSRRLDPRDAVMFGGLAILSLLAARNVPVFALAAAPIAAEQLDAWLAERGVRLNSARIPPRGLMLAANWIILALVILGAGLRCVSELLPERLQAAREKVFPLAAVQRLQSDLPAREMFNSYNWGGYLVWAARDYPVFVDGRTDIYDDPFVREYLRIYYAQPGWQAALDSHNVNLVLVESSAPLAQVLLLTNGWTQSYHDEIAVVFVRDVPVGSQP